MKGSEKNGSRSRVTAERPVHMVRRGAIAASIWQRSRDAGGVYFEYTLSRSWKSQNGGRQGYSHGFFSRNVGELSEVINEATRWIATREQAMLAEDEVSKFSDDLSAA